MSRSGNGWLSSTAARSIDEIEGKRACRIADYLDGDVTELERHHEYIDWFVDTGERSRRALAAVDP